MTTYTFRGLMAPVFTAYNDDMSVNIRVIPDYAKFLAQNGVPGVLVHGSTGEFQALSLEERKLIAEAWMVAGKREKLHVMIQVGGCPFQDAKELAAHAQQIGADSILSLPELYFKPTKSEQLVDYMQEIAKAAPNTPLFYYHVPMWSNVTINMEEFLNLSAGKIPTLQGIKCTSNDLTEAYYALKAGGGRYVVFLGADTLVQPAAALGINSNIATCLNFIPQHFCEIVKALKENRVEDSRAVQEKLTAACRAITKNGAWIPTMKVAMNHFGPVKVGLARPSLTNLNLEQTRELLEDLSQFIAL